MARIRSKSRGALPSTARDILSTSPRNSSTGTPHAAAYLSTMARASPGVGAGGVVFYTAPQSTQRTATRMFYVNSEGVIYSWRWQG
jgi:hypothetical protein